MEDTSQYVYGKDAIRKMIVENNSKTVVAYTQP